MTIRVCQHSKYQRIYLCTQPLKHVVSELPAVTCMCYACTYSYPYSIAFNLCPQLVESEFRCAGAQKVMKDIDSLASLSLKWASPELADGHQPSSSLASKSAPAQFASPFAAMASQASWQFPVHNAGQGANGGLASLSAMRSISNTPPLGDGGLICQQVTPASPGYDNDTEDLGGKSALTRSPSSVSIGKLTASTCWLYTTWSCARRAAVCYGELRQQPLEAARKSIKPCS